MENLKNKQEDDVKVIKSEQELEYVGGSGNALSGIKGTYQALRDDGYGVIKSSAYALGTGPTIGVRAAKKLEIKGSQGVKNLIKESAEESRITGDKNTLVAKLWSQMNIGLFPNAKAEDQTKLMYKALKQQLSRQNMQIMGDSALTHMEDIFAQPVIASRFSGYRPAMTRGVPEQLHLRICAQIRKEDSMVEKYQNQASIEVEEMSEGDLQHVTGGGISSGGGAPSQAQKISEGTANALIKANRAAQDAKTLEKVREWQGWKALPFDGITKFPVTQLELIKGRSSFKDSGEKFKNQAQRMLGETKSYAQFDNFSPKSSRKGRVIHPHS